MNRHLQQGFALIDLMIMVTIIGILAAVVIPMYSDYKIRSGASEGIIMADRPRLPIYIIRSQASEGISMADEPRSSVSDFWNSHGRLPPNAAYAGLASASSYQGSYVSSITLTNGQLSIAYGNKADDKLSAAGANAITIYPVANGAGNLVWVCGSATPPTGTHTIATASGSAAVGSNTVDQRYLPSSCRTGGG